MELQELVLHFQPQFDLVSGDLRGFEALLRWQDDTGELVMPAEFLDAIEDRGMLAEVTRWVVADFVERVEAWAHRLPGGLRIALNLPPAALCDRAVLDDLRELVRDRPAVAERLALELSEAGALQTLLDACNDFLERVGGDVIQLTLDDCGTGPETARALQETPVQAVKLDTAIVAGMLDERRHMAVVHSASQAARERGLRVIAEGVERAEQDRALREAGCDIGQGDYYGYPAPAERAEGWLASGPGTGAGGCVG